MPGLQLVMVFCWDTRDTLLGDDEIGFEFDDFITHCLDLFLLDLKDLVPV